jgi:hypothetical protein
MMPKAQSTRRVAHVLSAALLFAAAATLSGCASMIADHLPNAVGGLPENAPERAAVQPEFPAVHDMPPARNSVILTEAEKKKIKDELNATRDRIAKDSAANQASDDAAATTGSTGRARNP